MYLPVFIARKYFLSKKNTNAINIISLVSMIGVLIGSMALIVVLSVYNGFEQLVISLYTSFYPDIQVSIKEGKTFIPDKDKLNELLKLEGVVHLSEVIEENVLLKYHDKQYIATIKGVDDNYLNVTGVDESIIRGEYKLKDKEHNLAVVGEGVEIALGLYLNSLFDFITVYMPKREKEFALLPDQAFNRSTINPVGVFSIQQDFDSKYMIVPIRFARKLLNYQEEVSALEISLQHEADINSIKENIQKIMGDAYIVKNRYQQNEFLYKLMKTERWAVYLILSFILFIAAFNIIGSLSMLVVEKKKDIATLKSMGADKSLIQKIFLYEGMLISILGACMGALLAIFLCLLQQHFGILRIQGSGTFVVDAYPVKMQVEDFLLVLVTVLVIGFLASWYPAKKASKQEVSWEKK